MALGVLECGGGPIHKGGKVIQESGFDLIFFWPVGLAVSWVPDQIAQGDGDGQEHKE